MDTLKENPLLDIPSFLLFRAYTKMMEIAEPVFSVNSITPRQYQTLLLLRHGVYSQQNIADAIGVNRNVIVSVVDFLETNEYAERVKNQENRRENNIVITDSGREFLRGCEKEVKAKIHDTFFGHLTDKEQMLLKKLLQRLIISTSDISV